MNKLFYSAICLGLVLLTVGCSGTCRSWSPRQWFANRPTPVRDFFSKGKACSTCQPPVGQLESYSENFAPGCEDGSCGINGGMSNAQPVYSGSAESAAPFYPSESGNGGIGNANSENRIRTNYPPAISDQELGSGLQMGNSAGRTNIELETPPMYGSPKGFN